MGFMYHCATSTFRSLVLKHGERLGPMLVQSLLYALHAPASISWRVLLMKSFCAKHLRLLSDRGLGGGAGVSVLVLEGSTMVVSCCFLVYLPLRAMKHEVKKNKTRTSALLYSGGRA
jgi:hypothetical protein